MTALFYLFSFTNFCQVTNLFHFTVFFHFFWLIPSLLTFYRVYWLSTEFIDFLPSLLTFYRVYWLSTDFSKYFSSFLFLVDFIPIFFWLFFRIYQFCCVSLLFFYEFIEFLSTLSSFYRVYWLLSFLSTLKLGIFCADFYRLYTDFSDRKP
jgi:hypothetical protein